MSRVLEALAKIHPCVEGEGYIAVQNDGTNLFPTVACAVFKVTVQLILTKAQNDIRILEITEEMKDMMAILALE